jgi:hypothetical protein
VSRAQDPELPVPLGVYAAAFTIALTTDDPYERQGALFLMREIGGESLEPVRARRVSGRNGQKRRRGTLGALIREVLEERLNVA